MKTKFGICSSKICSQTALTFSNVDVEFQKMPFHFVDVHLLRQKRENFNRHVYSPQKLGRVTGTKKEVIDVRKVINEGLNKTIRQKIDVGQDDDRNK